MDPIYARAHVHVFPSRSEGWPKVLSEGMAYGVVPIAGAVGSIPGQLKQLGIGRSHDPLDTEAFADSVAWYGEHPEVWREESARGAVAADRFTYTRYLEAVRRLLAYGAAGAGAACET
jgi:glycosyltransferase involved in cell wall biosynthesis